MKILPTFGILLALLTLSARPSGAQYLSFEEYRMANQRGAEREYLLLMRENRIFAEDKAALEANEEDVKNLEAIFREDGLLTSEESATLDDKISYRYDLLLKAIENAKTRG